MPDYREYYKARTALTDLISKDLLGPVTDNEILIEMPTQYYVMPSNPSGESANSSPR